MDGSRKPALSVTSAITPHLERASETCAAGPESRSAEFQVPPPLLFVGGGGGGGGRSHGMVAPME